MKTQTSLFNGTRTINPHTLMDVKVGVGVQNLDSRYSNSRDIKKLQESTGAERILGARSLITKKVLKGLNLMPLSGSDSTLYDDKGLIIRVSQMGTDKLDGWVNKQSFKYTNINIPIEDMPMYNRNPYGTYFIRLNSIGNSFSILWGNYITSYGKEVFFGNAEHKLRSGKKIYRPRRFMQVSREYALFCDLNNEDAKLCQKYIKETYKTRNDEALEWLYP